MESYVYCVRSLLYIATAGSAWPHFVFATADYIIAFKTDVSNCPFFIRKLQPPRLTDN